MSRRTALRAFVDDQLSTGSSFLPVAHKLQPPSPRAALVSRASLVARLCSPAAEIAVVTAPAGYGKTTLLAQLVAEERRGCAWLSLDERDNDPVVLLTYVALALDEIEPIDPTVISSVWGPAASVATQWLPRFGRMLGGLTKPFVLVLDDIHTVVSREALDVFGVLVADLPPGSLLVLAGRSAPPLRLGRLRVKRGLVEVGRDDLAFGVDGVVAMYGSLGLELTDNAASRLLERTEGWPAALYLAALSHAKEGVDDVSGSIADPGGSRLVADYLRDELLDGLDEDTASFLLGASCLDRLSGPLCDTALDRDGSAEMLEELARKNLLVIPLDQRREWYRLHHLLRESLRAELSRRGGSGQQDVHRRASDWFLAHGDADAAIHHAVQAGDHALAESLVYASFGQYTTSGRHATIQRWLGLFDDEQLTSNSLLAALVGLSRLPAGDGAGALHWLARAEAGVGRRRQRTNEAGLTPDVAVAILRATVREMPAGDMVADAGFARRRLPFGDWHAHCCLLLGAGEFMLGNDDDAAALLEEGVAEASRHAPSILALCLAHLAVLQVERGGWERATTFARRGRDVLTDSGLEAVPSLFLVTAMSSLVEAREGRVAEADVERLRTHRHLVGFQRVAPWTNLQARIALARASLLLGDRVAARTLLDEADRFLERVPDAIRVKEQVVEVRRSLRDPAEGEGWGTSSLTTAEIRVLQYLPTHLTLVEIADRLYVSRNTIKTQAISIYRKLGASSRGSAVDIARESGLLDHDLV